MKEGCGNDGLWTARKTKSRLSAAAHEPLEIAGAIPTFPQPRPLPPWKSGNPKTGFPLSHGDFPILKHQKKSKPKGDQSRPDTLVFRLISGLENTVGVKMLAIPTDTINRNRCGGCSA